MPSAGPRATQHDAGEAAAGAAVWTVGLCRRGGCIISTQRAASQPAHGDDDRTLSSGSLVC
jgi:hypothetical protein